MKTYPRREAERRGPFTASISDVDAWGRLHLRRITWRPEIFEDEGLDGGDMVFLAWDDDCPPLAAVPGLFGGVAFEEATGAHSHVATPYPAESLEHLVAGTYFIHE